MALMRHRSLEIEFSRRESRLIWSISQSFHRSSALFCPARCPSYKLSIYLLDAVRAIMLPYTSKYGWNLETLTLQPQWSQYGVCHIMAKLFLKLYHNFECSITSIIQEIFYRHLTYSSSFLKIWHCYEIDWKLWQFWENGSKIGQVSSR